MNLIVAYNQHYNVSYTAHILPKVVQFFKTHAAAPAPTGNYGIRITIENTKALIAVLGGSSVSTVVSGTEVSEWNQYMVQLVLTMVPSSPTPPVLTLSLFQLVLEFYIHEEQSEELLGSVEESKVGDGLTASPPLPEIEYDSDDEHIL